MKVSLRFAQPTLFASLLALTSLTAIAAPIVPPTTPVAKPPTVLTQVVINEEGEHLLGDNTGRTLYVFDLDQGKNISACATDCSEVWPPYLLNATEAQALVAPLATQKRANGQLQMTYQGRPVYTYAFDRHSADDQGDNLGNVWHYIQVAPAGK